ncbi:MAG TPA: hypothetical protein VGP93_17370 [Polyangiaceae bacterium]|nr:hypothetical protein [Polyangiaceae bacterium]
MGKGPLEDSKLRAIEQRLNSGRFDEAQRLLAALGERESQLPGACYLAARLLYQRGRLDRQEVAQRLREVLAQVQEFPEAQAMLRAAESGSLLPDASSFLTATMRPSPRPTVPDPSASESWKGPAPTEIPRAPAVPTIPAASEHAPANSSDPKTGFSTPVGVPEQRLPYRPRARDTLQELISRPVSVPPPSSQPTSPPYGAPLSGQPPSSGSAWRAKTGSGGDTMPPSSSPTERPGSPVIALGPRARANMPSAPGSGPVRESAIPDLTRGAEDPRATFTAFGDRPDAKVRSIRPGVPEEEAAPTALSVASLLDDGEPERALSLLDRWDGPLSPELVILRARGLWALKRRAAAISDLERVGNAPLVDPELRASCARLLIELDELERAVQQARRAHDDEPSSVMVRLTLAWALVRAARRAQHPGLYQQAESLLSSLKPRSTPLPALIHGLRACVSAELGDPERAIAGAQLAMGLDPHATDALAALAVASAKLGRPGDAERAWLRLREVSPSEADTLGPTLSALGVDVEGALPSSRGGQAARAAKLWDPLEIDLASGRREAAIGAVERMCADWARDPSHRMAIYDFSALAQEAAGFFTRTPVFRHFAPYDLSLASTSRLEAALSVLYGAGPRLNPVTGRHALLLLLGAYLGECVRQAFAGRWRGTLQAPHNAAVEVRDHEYAPFERVEQRLRIGRSIRLDTEVMTHPAAEPNAQRVQLDLCPPAPWDPAAYPSAEFVRNVGRALSKSVVGLYTAEFGGGPLDGSVASVSALDNYVALLAPPTAAPDNALGWVRRAALIVGGYLIGVVCENMDATYAPNDAAVGPLIYEIVLADGNTAHPVLQAYERLSGKRMTPLSDYVLKLGRKAR